MHDKATFSKAKSKKTSLSSIIILNECCQERVWSLFNGAITQTDTRDKISFAALPQNFRNRLLCLLSSLT